MRALKVISDYAGTDYDGTPIVYPAGSVVSSEDQGRLDWLLRDAPGCFEETDDGAPEVPAGGAPAASDSDGLDDLTVRELLQVVTDELVEGVGTRDRKADIIAAIRAHRAPGPQTSIQLPEDGAIVHRLPQQRRLDPRPRHRDRGGAPAPERRGP